MDCVSVSTKPDVEIAWYHGQSKVNLSDDLRYRMDSENCLYRLVIMGATVSDAGDWRCLATNSYGQCISACTLDVVGLSSFHFTSQLAELVIIIIIIFIYLFIITPNGSQTYNFTSSNIQSYTES